ncbi:ly6/PLAUR domain-containing protein 2-like [Discoglossus pictus]
MKVLMTLTLAAALWMELGQALVCYTCNVPTALKDCNVKTNCTAISPLLTFCKTSVYAKAVGYPVQGAQTVFRQCVQECTSTNNDMLGITDPVNCCNSDLCNRRGINPTDAKDVESTSSATGNISFSTLAISFLTMAVMFHTGL